MKPWSISTITNAFDRFIGIHGDTNETLLLKRIWFILALGSILYPLTEAIILASNGIYKQSLFRVILGVYTTALLIVFLIHKRHAHLLGFLLSLGVVLLGGIIQYRVGGLLHSAGIAFIALGGCIMSLLITKAHWAHGIFVLFLVTMIGGTVLQPYWSASDPTYESYYKVMYLSKFLTGTIFLYLISFYFVIQIRKIKESEKRSLEELDVAKTKFYTNMTHEFRTPLAMIRGWADHIADDPDNNLQEGLATIRRNGDKLLNMVNQLMDISKLEAGTIPLHNIHGDIMPLIKNIVEAHRGLAAIHGVKLHFIRDIEKLDMDHDPEKIEAVLVNILSNALKFTPDGGDIYVQAGKQKTTFILKVRDTGPGIPQDDIAHVFDRFYQVDDSMTRKSGGSGIGLAVTKGLVELMSGLITASSLPGEGATFTIQLPIKAEANTQGSPTTASAVDAPQHYDASAIPKLANGDDPLILIVEDHPEMLHFVNTVLNEDYRTLTARDGKEGLATALKEVPDVIIADIMMPEMDGYALCTALKKDIRTSHIPIILLTAKADRDSRIEGLEKGAEAYMTKPFSKRELLVRVRKLFELRQNLQQHYWSSIGNNDDVSQNTSISAAENDFLIKTKGTVLDRISDPQLNVETLAQDLHMSYSQLYRKIRSLTGRTPVQFLREVRLKKAKEILQSSDLTIAEVADRVGFEDPVYFTRIFKKSFGYTPSSFRVQMSS